MSCIEYDYIKNILNYQAFLNTNNGIIFEFTAARASQPYNIAPLMNDNLGFGDVSAIAVYNIASSSLDKLFYFQLSSTLDTTNVCANVRSTNITKYGINTKYKFNILFSTALTSYSNFTLNEAIKKDYVSYLAYSLIGTTNINVFSNTQNLLQTVTNMDTSFNNIINNNIAFCGINNSNPFLSNDMSNPFAHSSKQLVTGMINIAQPSRRQIFFNDLITQSFNQVQFPDQNIYWVRFHPGDKMSILINYISTSGLTPRSYKIILSCIANFIFPDYVSNPGLNPSGNLDPFYIFYLLHKTNPTQIPNPILDASFIELYNSEFKFIELDLYKQIGPVVNSLDLYYKTFLSNIRQPSNVTQYNGIMNNGINPSFQYIYLNSTITNMLYPSLRTIKQSLITSPYGMYPTLNDILNIQCDLIADPYNQLATNFIIRIYTRPNYTVIDNSMNPNDTFYGNYYDSVAQISNITSDYRYNLNELFPSWTPMLNTIYNKTVYYNDGLQNLSILGQQQILSICVMTYDINANIGVKNIIVTYK
jgi:hypothetical protein